MAIRVKGDPYKRLARAVVVRAALDYVLLRFPRASHRELLEWFHSEGRRLPPSARRIDKWRQKQVLGLRTFFENGGADLAKEAGCYDVIAKIRRPLDRNRVWVLLHRNEPKHDKHWRWRKANV